MSHKLDILYNFDVKCYERLIIFVDEASLHTHCVGEQWSHFGLSVFSELFTVTSQAIRPWGSILISLKWPGPRLKPAVYGRPHTITA